MEKPPAVSKSFSQQLRKGASLEDMKSDPTYKKYIRQFDKGLQDRLDKLYVKLGTACEKVELKIKKCEKNVVDLVRKQIKNTDLETTFAELLIEKELRSKVLTAQWTNYFLTDLEETRLDPISYAITRYCLNMAVSFTDVSPEYLLRCDVHKQLIFYASFETEIIAGPALMALCHVSLFPEIKNPIIIANVLPILMKRIASSNSIPVLTQVAKLVASLALNSTNRLEITNSGCMHGVLDLTLQTNKSFFNVDIQYAALCAVTNLTYQCNANRKYVAELSGIRPLLEIIKKSSNNATILEAIRALTNIVFCSRYVSGCVLSDGGDLMLVEVLQGSNILQQPRIVHAALAALTNLNTYDATQAHLALTPDLVSATIRIIAYAREPYVVAQAASLLLALMWSNISNKIFAAGKGACPVLVDRIVAQCTNRELDEENLYCIERLCHALSSYLLFIPNQEHIKVVSGIKHIAEIIRKNNVENLLVSISSVICVCVPSPETLLRYHNEEFICEVERYQCLPVLKKARINGFAKTAKVPKWIDNGIRYMSLADNGLQAERPWIKKEYVDMHYFMQEFVTEIRPDATIYTKTDLLGLIHSLY